MAGEGPKEISGGTGQMSQKVARIDSERIDSESFYSERIDSERFVSTAPG